MDIEITISVLSRPRPAETDLHTTKQYNNKIIMVHYGILLFDTIHCVFLLFICKIYVTRLLLLLFLLLSLHSVFNFLLFNLKYICYITANSSINNIIQWVSI